MPVSANTDPADSPGFGVYIHWPFCESKCPYCDFNSHVTGTVDHDRWRKAYAAEIAAAVAGFGNAQPTITSIFFGGGTPSLAEPETIARVIGHLCRALPTADPLEVTLEANPSSVEAGRFADYAAAGVNRVSLGIQSLRDSALRFLGRHHSRKQALQAIEIARQTFARSSFDLITARPGQDAKSWHSELGEAIGLATDHLSIYQLTIESGTAFARNGIKAANDRTGADLYRITQDHLATAGFEAYEISNHARPGFACRHNLTCWRGGGYLGIGPGAHGRLRLADGWVSEHRIHNPQRWLDAVERRGHGRAKRTRLADRERAHEIVMTAMRLDRGLHEADLHGGTNMSFADMIDTMGLRHLIEGGLVQNPQPGTIAATPEGRLRLNGVVAMLIGGSVAA